MNEIIKGRREKRKARVGLCGTLVLGQKDIKKSTFSQSQNKVISGKMEHQM